MREPSKVIIEMTAEGYTHKIFDQNGDVIWSDKFKMLGVGDAEGAPDCVEIHDCKDLEHFDYVIDAMRDLSFGPFGVAGALLKVKEGY